MNKISGKYCWKTGGYNYKADANKIGHEIEKIEIKTPEEIVNYARNEKTELHKVFEWDDKTASELYRKQQATGVLNSLVYVVRKDVNDIPKEIKAFVNTKKNEEYKPIEVVVSSPTEYNRLLEKAIRELKSTRKKYDGLEELKEIYGLIDRL